MNGAQICGSRYGWMDCVNGDQGEDVKTSGVKEQKWVERWRKRVANII